MILLIAIYTYYNFRFFAMPDEHSRKQGVQASECCHAFYPCAGLCGDLFEDRGREDADVFRQPSLCFSCFISVFYRMFYRNLSRLLLNNTCMLLCVSFIMLSRISFHMGGQAVCNCRGGGSSNYADSVYHRQNVAAC